VFIDSNRSPDKILHRSLIKPKTANRAGFKRPCLNLSLKIEKKSLSQSFKNAYKLSNDYEIMKILGSGSYAVVKLAIDKKTNEKVVIKISRKSSREKLRNEYEILKNLTHDHIIKPIKLIENDIRDESCLIFEFFNGIDLSEFITQKGVLDEDEWKYVIKQLASWVSYLHKEGIAHRDIKPENILINENKEIKLIDFNISKAKLSTKECKPSDESKFKSVFYTQISSPLYAAPELKHEGFYTESIDIWGIGIIMFTCLWGNITKWDSKICPKLNCWILKEQIELETRGEMRELLFNLLSEDPDLRLSADEVSSHILFLE